MKYFGMIVLALAVYFGLGWVAKDITFSLIEIDGETLVQYIFNTELLVYSCVAAAYIYLLQQFSEMPESALFMLIGPIAAFVVSAYVLPVSTGSIILYNLLNVIPMILVSLAAVTSDD